MNLTFSDEAIEAAALTRWVRSEEQRPFTEWNDAPQFVRKGYLETADLQLRAALAVDMERLAREIIEQRVAALTREHAFDVAKAGEFVEPQYNAVIFKLGPFKAALLRALTEP